MDIYGELFNEATDEEELAAFLGSPTRQAVMLARAYNSKERKLQINSTSRADELYVNGDETPAFVQVMERLREEAEERGLLSAKPKIRSVWSDAPADLAPEIPFAPSVSPKPETDAPEEKDDRLEYVAPDESELRFDDLPPMPGIGATDDEEEKDDRHSEGPDVHRKNTAAEPERKLIVPLAVLYALIAVPVTVLIACILLIPTFASLGVSGGCLYVGFKVIVSAFGGFSMFSDIMVVLGSGVMILALGLLFLWLFVWFIGGAIAGVINAAIRLGGKWCSREVEK